MLTHVRRAVACPPHSGEQGPGGTPKTKGTAQQASGHRYNASPIKGMFHVKLNVTWAFYTKVMSIKVVSKQSVIRTEKGFILNS